MPPSHYLPKPSRLRLPTRWSIPTPNSVHLSSDETLWLHQGRILTFTLLKKDRILGRQERAMKTHILRLNVKKKMMKPSSASAPRPSTTRASASQTNPPRLDYRPANTPSEPLDPEYVQNLSPSSLSPSILPPSPPSSSITSSSSQVFTFTDTVPFLKNDQLRTETNWFVDPATGKWRVLWFQHGNFLDFTSERSASAFLEYDGQAALVATSIALVPKPACQLTTEFKKEDACHAFGTHPSFPIGCYLIAKMRS